MFRTFTRVVLLSTIFILSATALYSQCLTAPPPDDCIGTEASLADNEVLTVGIKKWYYGAPVVYNQLTVRGGYLVVCSDLTISNFFMDSGIVMIRPGATLRIGGGAGIILRGNSSIYNYGTLISTSNISLDNTWASPAKPNLVINATPSAEFKMSNQYFVINNPNSFFVNKGKSEFWGIVTDYNAGEGSVCLGFKSETYMSVIYNNHKNTYIAPEGGACVRVNQYSQFRDTLTNSPNINICLGAGHVSDATCIASGCKPNAWGTPNIFNSCGSCGEIVILSMYVTNLLVAKESQGYKLSWKTNIPAGNCVFITERSPDGMNFIPVDTITVNNSDGLKEFIAHDYFPPPGYLYYRVKYVQLSTGIALTGNIIKVYHGAENREPVIAPNPFYNSFRLIWEKENQPRTIYITNSAGIVVYKKDIQSNTGNNIDISLPVPAGEYILKLVYPGKVIVKRIVKTRRPI